MSKYRYKAPQGSDSEFVDEILAEARKMRGDLTDNLDDIEIPLAQARPVSRMYEHTKRPEESPQPKQPQVNPPVHETVSSPSLPEIPVQPVHQPDTHVEVQRDGKKGFFSKKRQKKVTVGQDDIYYGLKLKTVEEVKAQRRKELNENGYSGGALQNSSPTSTFAHLFEDTQPDTSPEFEEKFRQLHLERQERVKQAIKEAGTEVEDVFSLYETSSQLEQTDQLQTLIQKNDDTITWEALYEEDLQVEQQNAELRQMIDDVLAKETVVEVEAPLHTESIFGLVAKERAQDTVDAEIVEEQTKKHEDSVLQDRLLQSVAASELKTETNLTVNNQGAEKQEADMHALDEKNVAIEKQLKEQPVQTKEVQDQAEKQQESTAFLIEEQLAAKAEIPTNTEVHSAEKQQEVCFSQENEKMVQQPLQEEVQICKNEQIDDEPIEDITLISEPVKYQFSPRPVRTFAITGIGTLLAKEAQHFLEVSNPKRSTERRTLQVSEKVVGDKASAPISVTEQPHRKKSAGQPPKAVSVKLQNTAVNANAGKEETQAAFAIKTEPPSVSDEDRHRKMVRLHNVKTYKEQERASMRPPRKKKHNVRKDKMRILTDIEEEDDEIPETMESVGGQLELEDFRDKADIRCIVGELRKSMHTLLLRSVVTGICTAVLLILGGLGEFRIFGANVSAIAYAVTSLVFLLIAIGCCITTVFHGLMALIRLRANADSSIAIATVVVTIQSIVLLFMQDALAAGDIHIYTSLITGGLLLNTLGKLTMVRRIRQNFKFIVANGERNTVEIVENAEMAAQMAKDCVAGIPVVAYQKKTKFFNNFLKNSYEKDCSELTSQVIAPLGFISSLVLFIVSLIISQNVGVGMTAFAASMCICVPMTNMLCIHLPVSRLCKLARKNGGMLVGFEAVDKFADTNAIMIEADDLFPKGTVELKGIKTFGEQSIDRVLLEATALMAQIGGPLSEVFLRIVQNRDNILPHVENITYEDECGAMGWVSGRRILVGNRDLMNTCNVSVSAVQLMDEPGRQTVYLAADNEVVGVLILGYHVSAEKKHEMQRIVKNGIGIIVKTTDPSITAEFICKQFDIDLHAITVLSGSLVHTYDELTGHIEEASDAMFGTKGKATCMMRVITACVREKSNISIVRLLQNISVILGFILIAFLVCFSALKQISTLAMVVYEVFWLIVLLILPKIRRS